MKSRPFAPVILLALPLSLIAWLGDPLRSASADVVVLKQGDQRREGQIVEDRKDGVVLRHSNIDIFIGKDQIKEIIRGDLPGEEEKSGDLLASQGKFAESLEKYNRALKAGTSQERIRQKIEHVQSQMISAEERAHKEQMDQAARALKEGRPADAIRILEKVRAELPEGDYKAAVSKQLAQAHFQNAQLLRDRVRPQDALVELRKAIAADPEYRAAILDLAEALRNDARTTTESMSLYSKVFAREDGAIPEAKARQFRYNWAILLFQKKEYPQALENFNLVYSKAPREFPQAIDYIAKIYGALREEKREWDIEGTVKALRSAIALNPSTTQTHYLLAQIYYNARRFPEAVAALRALIGLDGSYRNANIMLAHCHKELGDMKACQEALRAELKTNPRNYDAACELGDILLEGAKYSEALDEFDDAIRVNDAPGRAHLGRAESLRKLERFSEALEACEILRSRESLNADAIRVLGLIYFDQKKYSEADQEFGKALEILETKLDRTKEETRLMSEIQRQLGEVALATNQYNKAEELFRKASSIDPEIAAPYNGLGQTLVRLDRKEEAEDAFATALEQSPKEANFYLSMAFLYHREMERPGDAVPFYLKYLELGGADIENVRRYIKECGGNPDKKAVINVATLKSKIRQRRITSSLAVNVVAKDKPSTATVHAAASAPSTPSR